MQEGPVVSADKDAAQYADQLTEKNRELEAELSNARQKILELETQRKTEPIISFREMGTQELKKEETKEEPDSIENTPGQEKNAKEAAKSSVTENQNKRDDGQVALICLSLCISKIALLLTH